MSGVGTQCTNAHYRASLFVFYLHYNTYTQNEILIFLSHYSANFLVILDSAWNTWNLRDKAAALYFGDNFLESTLRIFVAECRSSWFSENQWAFMALRKSYIKFYMTSCLLPSIVILLAVWVLSLLKDLSFFLKRCKWTFSIHSIVT